MTVTAYPYPTPLEYRPYLGSTFTWDGGRCSAGHAVFSGVNGNGLCACGLVTPESEVLPWQTVVVEDHFGDTVGFRYIAATDGPFNLFNVLYAQARQALGAPVERLSDTAAWGHGTSYVKDVVDRYLSARIKLS